MKSTSSTKNNRARLSRVPVTRKVLADFETPLSVYAKAAKGKNSFLLESVEGGEQWGRYSIIGLPAKVTLVVRENQVTIRDSGEIIEQATVEDPLLFIEEYQSQFDPPPKGLLPRFSGGLVGYFGYDTMRYVEPKLAHSSPPDTLQLPDIYLLQVDEFIIFDNLKGEMQLVKYAEKGNASQLKAANKSLADLEKCLKESTSQINQKNVSKITEKFDLNYEFEKPAFLSAVDKVKRYIVDGDVMQVVLSQRLSVEAKTDSLSIYRALRHLNPSPYLYYFKLDDFDVVGSSPEILVRVENDRVTTRPLAGTRPRGASVAEDVRLEKELLADPKELAEHLMLIDLGRNDIGRIAEIGSVEVTEKMVIERYSHVMHISSTVEGKLDADKNAMDVLRATLPVGTLSGAPKIRALEIIDELEPARRGVYGGAIGYLSWNGDMDTAIAIRTAIIKNGQVFVQAGCGIVADSVPELEWEETINKGKAIFNAVAMARSGLKPTS